MFERKAFGGLRFRFSVNRPGFSRFLSFIGLKFDVLEPRLPQICLRKNPLFDTAVMEISTRKLLILHIP
jgi:hypothetical protein